jgi:ribosomal RNA-processing protein 8
VFADWLKRRPDWVVGDFGCGEAEMDRLIPNKVYSFDHVAANESVIVCDMSETGLAEHTLDVAVFSLSLMGVNYQDYLREAYRLVRYGGWLKAAQASLRIHTAVSWNTAPPDTSRSGQELAALDNPTPGDF